MLKHQWNTGRMYTEQGQRIVVEIREGAMFFSDLDRMINGGIPLGGFFNPDVRADKYAIEKLVMVNYDFGNYGHSSLTLRWE